MKTRIALLLILIGLPTVHAQVLEQVFSFSEARSAVPSEPQGSLVLGTNGDLYGVTRGGGGRNAGTIFKVTPAGQLTTLVEFTGNSLPNKGASPSGLMLSRDGNFYGTTQGNVDVSVGFSTVFRMTPSGLLTTLAEFDDEIRPPQGPLIQDNSGNFFGIRKRSDLGGRPTFSGELSYQRWFQADPRDSVTGETYSVDALTMGSDGLLYGFGSERIFTIDRVGGEFLSATFVVSVPGSSGINSSFNSFIQADDGNFYVMLYAGGETGSGSVSRASLDGQVSDIFDFASIGATGPISIQQGSDRNLYLKTGSGHFVKLGLDGVMRGLFALPGGNEIIDSPLVESSDGHFYGVAVETVFKLSPSGVSTTIFAFGEGSVVGAKPASGLVQGSDSSFYGTTASGGAKGSGTVFKVTPAGEHMTLVEFAGTGDGSIPLAGLMESDDGQFYGTTSRGGASDSGTVFRITPEGMLTTLVNFTGNGPTNKGSTPEAALVDGRDGFFYGTTRDGGTPNAGTVFKMAAGGELTTLVEFTVNGVENKGRGPGQLVAKGDTEFFGTTLNGGGNDCGTIFRMNRSGQVTTVVEFSGNGAVNKGRTPIGRLAEGLDGNYYGRTRFGGAGDGGTIFRLTPDGVLSTLVENVGDGFSGCVTGPDGNIYGSTFGGGGGNGTVFQLAPGSFTTIADFPPYDPLDGRIDNPDARPVGDLMFGEDGNLYGVTEGLDSAGGVGMVYRIVFKGPPSLVSVKTRAGPGSSVVVSAVANARGAPTTLVIEYWMDGQTTPHTAAISPALSGYQTRAVGTVLTGLPVGAAFFYRLKATSVFGTTIVTPIEPFTVPRSRSAIVTSPTSVTSTSAQFNGIVNAGGLDTTVAFEWGTDGNTFLNSLEAMPNRLTDDTDTLVKATVAGLPEGGIVFYRLRTTSVDGTTISGARSFSTVSATTSNPLPEQVGVTEATFRATINTFGQTAAVKFKYWADAAPGNVFETATLTVTSNGPTEVSARVTGLLENVAYSYRVSVELAGTETDGGPVVFMTQMNQAPVAVNDLIFYSGQVVVDPLANDSDPNEGTNVNLLLDPVLVVAPNASRGVASVTTDRRFISYNPQFNVLDDDALTYRVVDPLGASAQAQVRLVAFRKRAGHFGGTAVVRRVEGRRELRVAVEMTVGGGTTTSFMSWPAADEDGLLESFRISGAFDQRGRITRTFNSPSGAALTLTLRLDADEPVMHGTFEEKVNDVSTTGVIAFTLTKNAGTGGLAESGLRTGFLSPPPEQAGVMADGFLRMTVGKDRRRGARFAGRLPDGEPFLAGAAAVGRTYTLVRKLEQGGLFTGLVRAIDTSAGAGGMMGDLSWQKRASGRARFHRGVVDTVLSLSGVAYDPTERGELPPLGLGTKSPNARLRLSGGDLTGTYRDLLLNVLPGRVEVVGLDTKQMPEPPTAELLTLDPSRVTLKVNGATAKFTGRFFHPQRQKLVPFEGALRAPFDEQPAQGRGVFRDPDAAGAVLLEAK